MNSNNYNNNNLSKISLRNVSWIKLNKKGLIKDPSIRLNNKAAIYIFQLIKNKSKIYVGSTSNLRKRINQHRYSVNNGRKDCPKFYNFIRKHGWDNFRLGILEYCDKESLIKREQYYLDTLKPNLNINKTARSTLGYKHSKKKCEKLWV